MNWASGETQLLSHLLKPPPPPLTQDPWWSPDPGLGTTGLSHPTLQAPCYYCLPGERAICKIKVAYCLGLSGYGGWSTREVFAVSSRVKWAGFVRASFSCVLRLRLLGARMLDVLADTGAHRARRERRRDAEGRRKDRGAFSYQIGTHVELTDRSTSPPPFSSQMHLLPQSLSCS